MYKYVIESAGRPTPSPAFRGAVSLLRLPEPCRSPARGAEPRTASQRQPEAARGTLSPHPPSRARPEIPRARRKPGRARNAQREALWRDEKNGEKMSCWYLVRSPDRAAAAR